jgi:antitoxin component YwqK of YwqJK toxin-antitoxin module
MTFVLRFLGWWYLFVANLRSPMPTKKSPALKPRLVYHKDGSLWAKGQMKAGKMHGYWEWFRKDGTKMRSGHFVDEVQCGEWITYDAQGKVYKVTQFKAKVKKGG